MRVSRNASLLSLAFALMLAVGCTDSPTEPSGSGTPITPKPPAPVTTFTVSVTASPNEIVAGGAGTSNITVQARRTDNGQAPPDLTPVLLTTSLGAFGSPTGPQTLELQLVNGQAQAVLYGTTETGTATVRAPVGHSTGVANVRIGEAATFFVSSVEPNVGNPAGGEQVVILGGGFEQPVRVTFNGAAATVRSVSPNRIVAVTPSAAAANVPIGVGQTASVPITVTVNVNEVNQLSDTIDRGFTYASGGGNPSQPQVFSVTPQSGDNDGGTPVTIVGEGFQSPVQVLFGLGASAETFDGVEAQVDSVTPTRIVVRTPAATGFGQNLNNQLVDILIKNVNTGFSTVRRQQFKYGTDVIITALDTGSGPYTGGTRVAIQGQGFDEPVAVSFSFEDPAVSVAQSVVSTSGRQIIIHTSPAPLPDECPANGLIEVNSVRVVNIESGDSADAAIGFNFIIPLPQIFNLNPSSGAPGINATITGANFAANTQVLFGSATTGSSASVIASGPNSITVRVPNAPQGFNFIQEPCDGNGDGNPGGTRNAPTPISVSVRNLNGTGCSTTLPNSFLLTPPNVTCNGDTTTPPPPPVVQCNDGFDNDGDTLIDAADPQCTGPTDNTEGS
ncbi:MAG TPA: IPT/TIG domain-containing protein [Thermoanaerobaculia bacterium]|nr:IPT/TIG domain-containing protein [Thermoanaerobaculia bacterium]